MSQNGEPPHVPSSRPTKKPRVIARTTINAFLLGIIVGYLSHLAWSPKDARIAELEGGLVKYLAEIERLQGELSAIEQRLDLRDRRRAPIDWQDG